MERLLKRFPSLITPLQYLTIVLLYLQCSFLIGIAAFPSIYMIYFFWQNSEAWPLVLRLLVFSVVLAAGYFLYAIVIIFVIAGVCLLFRLKIKEGRYFVYSTGALRWANYNSLILIVRYTCMNFLRVTPFLPLFYQMMGAKMGRNVQINTTIIGDAALLEIGNNTVIGGDVTLVAHVAEGHELIIKKVKIGSHVTVGMMSIIMPGVTIGDNVMIAANTVIPKDTQIPANTRWAGIPAKQISPNRS